MKECYEARKFQRRKSLLIEQANAIIDEYMAKDLKLTVRQLHYQFVARDLYPNTLKSYKDLVTTMSDARMAGLVDWEAFEDRSRGMIKVDAWSSPEEIIESAARSYCLDMWERQSQCVEVWVEKAAMVGVIARACRPWQVPCYPAKGYDSVTMLYDAFTNRLRYRKGVTVLYLGDHDPSGMDMDQVIEDRRRKFGALNCTIKRIALTSEQVEEYDPPPNPVKDGDSRSGKYVSEHGDECWELDALDPEVVHDLIESEIKVRIDEDQWAKDLKREKRDQAKLAKIVV